MERSKGERIIARMSYISLADFYIIPTLLRFKKTPGRSALWCFKGRAGSSGMKRMLFCIVAMSVRRNHQVAVSQQGALGSHFVVAGLVMTGGVEVMLRRQLKMSGHFFVIGNAALYFSFGFCIYFLFLLF